MPVGPVCPGRLVNWIHMYFICLYMFLFICKLDTLDWLPGVFDKSTFLMWNFVLLRGWVKFFPEQRMFQRNRKHFCFDFNLKIQLLKHLDEKCLI